MKTILQNWEPFFFRILGLASFTYMILGALNSRPVSELAGAFGIGFFCFFYANISRFKRFKGLGFEAELWEDKQREAAALVDKLKAIISIYSNEVILSNVQAGRWDGGTDRWEKVLDLLARVQEGHERAGQEIRLDEIRETIVLYFIFDASLESVNHYKNEVRRLHSKVSAAIDAEFGKPVKDPEGYSIRRREALSPFDGFMKGEPWEFARERRLATTTLEQAEHLQRQLRPDDEFVLDFNVEHLERLVIFSKWENDPDFFPTGEDVKRYQVR